jgi:hypothetical protein
MTTSLIEQEQVETNRLMAEVESMQRRGYGERQIAAAMARAVGPSRPSRWTSWLRALGRVSGPAARPPSSIRSEHARPMM